MAKSEYINQGLLKANATAHEVESLCNEAIDNDFTNISVNPKQISKVKQCLIGTKIKISAVIGFPLGAKDTATKLFEAQEALDAGVEEIDVVMNMIQFKAGNYGYVAQELRDLRKLTQNQVLKIIIETSLLNDKDLIEAVQLVTEINADFIKTIDFSSTQEPVDNGIDTLENTTINHKKSGVLIMETISSNKKK